MKFRNCLIFFCLIGSIVPPSHADWPTVRGDAARSGRTEDPLPADLAPLWVHRPPQAPQPAWPREDRMIYDRAFHVTAARGIVFFGSSADGTVTALDAATGKVRWTFFTDGPVRFAPQIWQDKVYVVSDDGFLRALSMEDGRLLQEWPGGPESDLVLGNGRIISRYPARGGPVIVDAVLYFGAGIWQSEGIYLTAIDLATGKVLWVNDTAGAQYMPQPHGGANAESGVTIQGYLAADADQIFVPTGRAVPAAFNRADGKFQYYHLQQNGKKGGSEVMVSGEEIFNIGANYNGISFHASSGEAALTLNAGAYAALPDGVLHGAGTAMRFLRRKMGTTIDRKGASVAAVQYAEEWKLDGVPAGEALIVAGQTAVSAGGGKLAAVDLNSRAVSWTTELAGTVYGLAASEGRLFASMGDGSIHCFAAKGANPVAPSVPAQPIPSASSAALAEAILERAKVTEGYAVILGDDGSLSRALAERSELQIVALDPDPETVAKARRELSAAGLYGSRVTMLRADLRATRLPKFIFNLVVSTRGSHSPEELAEAKRLQRPYGGVACLGPIDRLEITERGAPERSGEWTHQYADAANTSSSVDEIKGPLRVLWFHDMDLSIPQRHGRGPAPLFSQGRLFAMGMDELIATDAYNGRELWRFPLPGALQKYNADHLSGTAITGSTYCLAGDSVYVRHEGVAHRLDAASGKLIRTYTLPAAADGKPVTWGFIACQDGILYGSSADREHVVKHGWKPADMSELFSESKSLLAFDVETGNVRWRYDAKDSIRHNAIAIAGGHVYLIDRPVAEGDLLVNADARRSAKDAKVTPQATGKLVRLQAQSGEVEWSKSEDIWGTMLAYSEPQDLLLMSYQSTRFKLPSELGGRLAVYHGSDGYKLWEKAVKYTTRPLIRNGSIVAEGGSWDLQSGTDLPFEFKRSYGCGQLAASKNLLLFRSATFGYFDTSKEAPSTKNFGGVRPGCWINALPVGGLVLLPDASAGCSCSYQNRSWMALQGSE